MKYLSTCSLAVMLSTSKDQQDFSATKQVVVRDGTYLSLKKTSKIDHMNFAAKLFPPLTIKLA